MKESGALLSGSIPSSGRKRVFLIDDHAILRNGLRELINHSGDMMVCGEAGTAEEALRMVALFKPDAAIVDLSIPGNGGIELLRSLKSTMPTLNMLVLSMYDESSYAEHALQAGARGYIMKREAIEQLLAALREILHGGMYLSARMSERLLRRAVEGGAPKGERLSNRELAVLELVGQGYGVTEIAGKLGLSIKTIDTYKVRLRQKLHLSSAGELLRHALDLNIANVRPPEKKPGPGLIS